MLEACGTGCDTFCQVPCRHAEWINTNRQPVNLQQTLQSGTSNLSSAKYECVGVHPQSRLLMRSKSVAVYESLFTFIPLQERLLKNDRKLSATAHDDAAAWRVKSRLDRWHVVSHSALQACAALHKSLTERCWNICCTTSEGSHGNRAWDLAAEHILVAVSAGTYKQKSLIYLKVS